jgi:hypothetical protein
MSAFEGRADLHRQCGHVCSGPKADMGRHSQSADGTAASKME